jgi:D-beta-D-heptose 7-phosphate kinase / D-beta-D-heptose 1-phosphate adenosyltransferase
MTDRSGLLPLVERIGRLNVACVGDMMLDRWTYGAVERVSPEAPVPVLRVERRAAMPGGAGNVVRNLRALGARVRLAAVVGDDGTGAELRAALEREGAAVVLALMVEAGRRTPVKTRFLAGTQQLLRADDESIEPLGAGARREILAAVAGWRVDCPVLILSDYAKGMFVDGLAAELIAAMHAGGGRVVVDPKAEFGRYRGADVITPNRRELVAAAAAEVRPGEEGECARGLARRFDIGAVLVTLGKDGMLLIDPEGAAHTLPAAAREVFDVSGAGDTVAATVAAALAAGAPLRDAAELANVAAGIVVGKVGTAVAHAREVAQALRHRDLLRVEAKVVEPDELRERAETWRRRGLRIGFTNGCFDLIHPGHLSLLRQAKAACDRLVVGLNTDASVARLKGPGRPVQPEVARAAVLASIAGVDAVVLFDEETPLALIELLRPDVLVKGADYRLDEVVGAALVQSYGGRVLLAQLEPGYSTSATIASFAP